MKKILNLVYLTSFFLCTIFNLQAQVPAKFTEHLMDYTEITIDLEEFKTILQNAPLRSSLTNNRNSTTIIQLPIPTGGFQRFRVVEAPILSTELSASRPDVKSYMAKGIDDPTANARFNITTAGFYGLIKSVHGISVIERISSNRYITYYDHNIVNDSMNEFECQTEDNEDIESDSSTSYRLDSCFQIGNNLREYDIVLTCSGEFYTLNGGTDPLVEAALLARMTQVNTVYETEVATTFTIVEFLLNNNPATDPYSDPTNTSTSLTETLNYINSNVTVGSWDIGHGFHEITCGGSCGWAGRAGLAVVCTPNKARGYTYLPNDIPTNITVLVHEFGHQFSNRHTNYGCNSNNACSRYEPGRGSTIMSTGAGCDAGDFFANRTDYFSVASLQNMTDFMGAGQFVTGTSCGTVTISGWSDCADLIPTGNNMPSSNANVNNINGLVIPHSTPFVLTGQGTDVDGTGSLTYCWEQYDTDYSGSDAPDDTGASTTAPLFRSFPPTTSNERTVPVLSSILAGNVTTGTGEVLPTVARTLTWRLTVRDNEIGGGGVACDQIALSVGSDGPFQITSQNSTTAWLAGNTETITWDVANTDSPTYTCANIDILYSSDGGTTFPVTLASGVANNGSANITVPGAATTNGRIKIVCTGGTNIFFDINDIDIAIISSCGPVGGAIANSSSVTAEEGDPSLDLDLLSGVPINSVSGVLDSSDPNTNLTVENNGSGTCIFFGNSPKYETIELATGSNASVTFTRTGQPDYTSMIGLFEGSYNPSSVCDNWLNSNGNFTGSSVSISSNFTEALSTGTIYVLQTSGFSSGTPPVGNYNVSFSQTLYDIGALNAPGYLYTYVIVNNTSGNVVAFDTNTDLTNNTTYPPGGYSIFGLSYLASENLTPYLNNAFSVLQSDITGSTICGAFSSNSVSVTITAYNPTIYTFNSGTWLPEDPIGTSDTRDDILIQTGDYTLTTNLTCDEFTVNPGASLTINGGVNLTVDNAMHLESVSTAYSSLILNGSITGTINYNRYTAQVGPVGTNDLISAPVSGQTFGVFDAANTNLPASGNLRAFAIFNTGTGLYENYDAVVNSATSISSGTGYRTATTDGSTLTFTGTALATDLSNVPISDALAGDAWNLIGNPYPSYLDFSLFFAANQTEFDSASAYQAIYGYDGDASNGWTVWNQATIIDPAITEIIAPGQAFFVKSKIGGGLVDFTTNMRRTGNDDDFIAGMTANDFNIALSKLRLTSNTNEANTSIYFLDGASRGLDDGYDAGSFQGVSGEFSIYTILLEDDEGLDIAIQSLPYNDFNDVVIPLGVKSELVNGSLTISLDGATTLPSSVNVYLEDTEENTLTLLNNGPYNFMPSGDVTGTGRFFLRYSSDTLSDEDSEFDQVLIYVDDSEKNVIIKGPLNMKTSAVLYDIQGRKVISTNLNGSVFINMINVDALSSGLYIIQLDNGTSVKTQKLIIR